MNLEDAIQFANDRPTSCDDDLYQWAVDAEYVIRELVAEVRKLARTHPPLVVEKEA